MLRVVFIAKCVRNWVGISEINCKKEANLQSTELPKLTYTKHEAAKILNVPESSINWQLRKGKLPYRKISGRIRFTLEDLQVFVEQSKVT